jgi:hypothetical protein
MIQELHKGMKIRKRRTVPQQAACTQCLSPLKQHLLPIVSKPGVRHSFVHAAVDVARGHPGLAAAVEHDQQREVIHEPVWAGVRVGASQPTIDPVRAHDRSGSGSSELRPQLERPRQGHLQREEGE